jgi:hypothetical protein
MRRCAIVQRSEIVFESHRHRRQKPDRSTKDETVTKQRAQPEAFCDRGMPFALGFGVALLIVCGSWFDLGRAEEPGSKDSRLPVPNAAARAKSDASVQEVFGREIEHARSSAEQVALVDKLLSTAEEEQDAEQRYAILMRARATAIASGDVHAAMHVVEKLVHGYRIDAGRAELVTLQALAKSATTHGQQAKLAEEADSATDRALVRDAAETASDLNKIAAEAARRAGEAELHKRLVLREKELQETLSEFNATKSYRSKLEQNPDDPAANLALGKYHCFYRHDWQSGLPLLAKGDDAALKLAATKDLEKPSEAAEMAKLGDMWWVLGEGESGRVQEAARWRAAHWYHQALPKLSGLARARAEQRLASAGGADEKKSAEMKSAETRRSSTKPAVGANSAQWALVSYVAEEVNAHNVKKSAELGFTLGNEAFSVMPEGGGLLVELDVTIGNFNKITGIRPRFLTSKGIWNGPAIGEVVVKGGKGVAFVAKRGYAIGAITVKGGIGIDALGVTYMAIDEDGVNTQRTTDGPMVGSADSGTMLGGDGAAVVGIFGHRDKTHVAALGIIQVERRK